MSGFKGGDNTNLSQKKSDYLIALIIVLALVVIGWYFGTSDDGKFTEWSACDKNCGEGTQTRTYVPPIRNGKDLPDKNILTKLCNNKPCPIDGKLSEWSTWGDCDKPCGSGIKTQTRTYTAPLYGGDDLTDKNVLINTQSCNTNPCVIDGKYNAWSNWGTCVKSKTDNSTINCGSGEQRRTRTYSQPMNGGNDDADYQGNDKSALENKLLEWRNCTHDTIPNCPINGTYNNWGGFGTCVKSETDNTAITCGTGKKSKTRTYNTPQYGGVDHKDYKGTTDLSRKLIEWEGCTHSITLNCPVDGSYSNWINDGLCAKSATDSTPINCGSGIQKRIKTYTQPQYNGLHATGYTPGNTDLANGLVNYDQVCSNAKICQPANALCSDWVNDGTAICVEGQYQQKQKRTYTAAVDGGTELTNTPDNNLCKTSLVHEKYILMKSDPNITLSEGKCPANGIMSDFSALNINNCTPTTGKNRSQYVVSTYTFPTSNTNTHATKFIEIGFSTAQITAIKALTKSATTTPNELTYTINNIEYKITRTNTIFPYTYEIKKKVLCGSVYNFSTSEINTAWKESTGCSQDLSATIYNQISTTETIDDLRYLDSLETNVKPKFNPFTKNTLINNKNTDKIKLCYGSDNGYVTVDNTNKTQYSAGTILPSGLKFTATDIAIVHNSTHRLLINGLGEFVFIKLDNLGNSLFKPSYTAVDFGSLIMQHDGNLVVYSNATTLTALWTSGTGGNAGAYLELDTGGSLMIKKSNGEIIKYLYITNDQINTAWTTATGCTQGLNDSILTNLSTSYSALSILADVATKFNPFTKNSLTATPNTSKIKLCYGDNGSITVDNTNKTQYSAGTILPSGLKFTATDIAIVHNSTHRLLINGLGEFVFIKLDNLGNSLFKPSYTAGNFGSLVMQHDGNLVVYSNATTLTALWASGTSVNNGAYLELATNGSLMIKSAAGVIIKYLYSNGIMTVTDSPSNFPSKVESSCTPLFGVRTQDVKVQYTFPTIDNGSHDPNFTAIGFTTTQEAVIKNLSLNTENSYIIGGITYKIKRTNTTEPKQYEITKTLTCDYIQPLPTNWKNKNYSTTIVNGGTRCGPNYGACPDNKCCSSVGYCGGTTGDNGVYCKPFTNGDYSDKEPKNWAGISYSTTIENGGTRCGPNYGACADNKCCSSAGYCGGSTGNDDVYCSSSQLYGKFNYIEPTTVIHGQVVKEIVLANRYFQAIFIEPYVFKRIINDNSIDNDDGADLGCTGDEYSAVNAYNIIDARFAELTTSSQNMKQKYSLASEFNRDEGSPHDNDTKIAGCTTFHNLYNSNRYTTEKASWASNGFKNFDNDINNNKNWLRWSRGNSEYSYYWRVYYS